MCDALVAIVAITDYGIKIARACRAKHKESQEK